MRLKKLRGDDALVATLQLGDHRAVAIYTRMPWPFDSLLSIIEELACKPVTPVFPLNTGKGEELMTNLVQGASKTATLNLTDANGVARPLPAGVIPAWTDSASLLTITPAVGGMSAQIVAGPTDGATNLTAVVTYPDGDEVTVTLPITIVDPEDTQGTITLS